jgi:pantetheine-phosphate adenylyltransferase
MHNSLTQKFFLYFIINYSKERDSMRRVIYPGTFDPVTYGHIDIVRRAVALFDEVVVTVAINPSKKPLFTTDERVEMLRESLKEFDSKVIIDSFDGLLVEHAKQVGATAIVRGLRQISDFEFEFQMALMNRKLSGDITTIFLMPHERYTYLNSTVIRNVASLHGDISNFVPPVVHEALKKKFG